MINLYVADISELMHNPELYATCYALSTIERREKADKRKCLRDKVRCIGAGLLLQYAYLQFGSGGTVDASVFVPVEELVSDSVSARILPPEKEGENGKPYWEHAKDDRHLYFNLSHSGDMAACIIADAEVGLDIQKICRVREAVVRRCFLQEEAALLEGTGADRTFTRIWSQKEAVAKLTGKGLSQILESPLKQEKSCTEISVLSRWINEDYVLSYACYK